MRVRAALWIGVVVLASVAASAQEQPADRSFDLTLFTPQPGPTDYLGVRATRLSPHRGVGFSLVFDYQDPRWHWPHGLAMPLPWATETVLDPQSSVFEPLASKACRARDRTAVRDTETVPFPVMAAQQL